MEGNRDLRLRPPLRGARDRRAATPNAAQAADLRKVDPVALRRAARELLIEDTRLRSSLRDANSVR